MNAVSSILIGVLCFAGACMALQSTAMTPSGGLVQRNLDAAARNGILRLRGGGPSKVAVKGAVKEDISALKKAAGVLVTPKTFILVAIVAVVNAIKNAKHSVKVEAPKKPAAVKAKSGFLGLGCCGL